MSVNLCNPIVKHNITSKIVLNDTETKITNLLNKFVNHYNQINESESEPLVLRITGGWVRDKLLGLQSNDIDIAINKLSGEQFVLQLQDYLIKENEKSLNIHKINKNPEKSKHLETITTKLFDQNIDFVNLRNEEYTNENSRVPSIVEFGTPKQDSLRRDANLNAMFYNLTTKNIEDFTNEGLKDLQDGILKTPLEPFKTFKDDPLRILRLIRFTGQFGFDIDSTVLNNFNNEELQLSLLKKVSKERVAIELTKLIKSKYPLKGLKILNDYELFKIILNVNNIENRKEQKTYNDYLINEFPKKFNKDIELVNEIYNDLLKKNEKSLLEIELFKILSNDIESDLQKNFFLLLIFKNIIDFFPAENYNFNIKVNNKLKPFNPVDYILKENLQIPKNESDLITKVLMNNKHNLIIYSNPNIFDDLSIICFEVLKNFKSAQYWKLSLLLNYLNNYPSTQFDKIWEFIVDNKLEDVYNEKIIIDGKELSKFFNRKPGKWLMKINDEILKWQFKNKNSYDKDYLKTNGWKFLEENKELFKKIIESS